MRRITFPFAAALLASLLGSAAAAGQSAPASTLSSASSSSGSTATPPSASQEAERPARTQPADLPVSLDKIKEALQKAPGERLRGLNERATFSVEIRERQRIEDLLATIKVTSGPVPPGGALAFEMQRIMHPPNAQPLMQPYAAFSTSELLTIAIENLAGRYLVGRAMESITAAERERAEQAARDEVRAAMADFCASQPNRGASLVSCMAAPPPADNR